MPFKEGESGNKETQFGQGQDPTKGGRKPKLETVLKRHFLGQYGERLSNTQVSELIESLLSMSADELNEIAKDKDLPFWVMLIIKKANADYKKGSFEIVEKLLDRAHGRPKQKDEAPPPSRQIVIQITTQQDDDAE